MNFKKFQKSKLKISSHSFFPKSNKINKTFYMTEVNEMSNILKNYYNYELPTKTYFHKNKRKNKVPYNIKNMKYNQDVKEYSPYKEKEKNKEKEKEKEKKERIKEECDNKIYKYSYEYLIQFQTWEKSNQIDLLTESLLNHIDQMEKYLKEIDKKEKKYIKSKSNNSICNTSISSSSSIINASLETWGRKDYTKETKVAEENKIKLKEYDEKDIIKKQLRELLNKLTKDNYEFLKDTILEIIKDKIENQEKFLDIIFIKAIKEKSYSELYANLCKYLNKKLPQKSNKTKKEKIKNISSVFRDKLIDKCKKILKSKNYEEYIKEEDQQEKIIKLKKIILGNTNFLTELVKIKMLSKKSIIDCINYLFERYEKDSDKILKTIFIESIIIFTDKLGTLIHSEKTNKKKEEINKHKQEIEEIFKKLEKIKDDKELPGHIIYLIINLIEKKKNNFKESQYEKYIRAKSKQELEEEMNNKDNEKEKKKNEQENIKQEIIEKIKKDLNEYKDFIEDEGNSKNYNWEITTDLYDVKLRSIDDILEGYIVSSGDFIEQESNIKYAKDYIKEFIGFYHKNLNEEEINNLRKRIFNLLTIVIDIAFETPKIYDIYAYVMYILIQNNILKKEDIDNKFKEISNKKDINLDFYKNIEEYLNSYLKTKEKN